MMMKGKMQMTKKKSDERKYIQMRSRSHDQDGRYVHIIRRSRRTGKRYTRTMMGFEEGMKG